MKLTKGYNKVDIFLNELLSGVSQRQAYYVAYPHSKRWQEKTVDSKASKLMGQDTVRQRYNELMKEYKERSIIERRELLRIAVKGLKIAIGEEYDEQEVIKYAEKEGKEVEIKSKMKLKVADLKAVKGLVETISRLEGWNKEENKATDGELEALNTLVNIVKKRFDK